MPQGTIGEELRALRAQTAGRVPVANSGELPAPDPQASQGLRRSKIKALGTGMLKGAGDTAINLGELVHSIPGIGDLTDKLATMVGPEGTNPETAFGAAPGAFTKPESGAESAGKTIEQIAEFFTPVKGTGLAKIEVLPSAVRKGLITKLVSMIPNSAGPDAMKLMNKLATYTGRVAGDAGTSAAVSVAHGADEGEAERAGLMASLGPAVLGPAANATAKGATKFAGSPMGRQILPYMTALGTSAAGNFSGAGLGAGLGAFGLTRMLARRLLDAQHITPRVAVKAGRAAQAGVETGTRLTAAGTDTLMPRRRLEK